MMRSVFSFSRSVSSTSGPPVRRGLRNTTVRGNNLTLYDCEGVVVIGNNCDIQGRSCTVVGNNCDFVGDHFTVTGNNCDGRGHHATVTGNNCDITGDYATICGLNAKAKGAHARIVDPSGGRKRPSGSSVSMSLSSGGSSHMVVHGIGSVTVSGSGQDDDSDDQPIVKTSKAKRVHRSEERPSDAKSAVLPAAPAVGAAVEDFKPAEAAKSDGLCAICLSEPATVVMLHCAHMCACGECALELAKNKPMTCPMCREPVVRLLEPKRV